MPNQGARHVNLNQKWIDECDAALNEPILANPGTTQFLDHICKNKQTNKNRTNKQNKQTTIQANKINKIYKTAIFCRQQVLSLKDL